MVEHRVIINPWVVVVLFWISFSALFIVFRTQSTRAKAKRVVGQTLLSTREFLSRRNASNKWTPSITSFVAFAITVIPMVYVLSYAPLVLVSQRTVEVTDVSRLFVTTDQPLADGSLYPMYSPVDWLIDNTRLREPLFFWAGMWDVRDEFETGESLRSGDFPVFPLFLGDGNTISVQYWTAR